MPRKASVGRCGGGVVEAVEAILVAQFLGFPFPYNGSPASRRPGRLSLKFLTQDLTRGGRMADLLLPGFCRHEIQDLQAAESSIRSSIETIEYQHRAADARCACFCPAGYGRHYAGALNQFFQPSACARGWHRSRPAELGSHSL